jgi:hypothetical protein
VPWKKNKRRTIFKFTSFIFSFKPFCFCSIFSILLIYTLPVLLKLFNAIFRVFYYAALSRVGSIFSLTNIYFWLFLPWFLKKVIYFCFHPGEYSRGCWRVVLLSHPLFRKPSTFLISWLLQFISYMSSNFRLLCITVKLRRMAFNKQFFTLKTLWNFVCKVLNSVPI